MKNMNEEHKQELKRLAELPADEIGDNENNVKYNFIIPFLETFGYNKKLDFEHSAQGNRIDILIDKVSDHCILIEAKSYGKNLDDYIPQVKRYCDEKRPILAIICNGEQIRFYSPFWKKADFAETLIYSITRHDLSNDNTVDRIEAVLSKESLEEGSIVEHIEKREREINNIKKQFLSTESQYQQEIATLVTSISNLENQIKSLQSQIDSQKAQLAEKKQEAERKIEELKKEHLVFIPQPKQDFTIESTKSKPAHGKRRLGRKGYEQLKDYLFPIIRLIGNGVNHTDAFHKIANQLDVTYQTANAQCTVRLGNISTEKFVDLIKSNRIKFFLKEKFPEKASLIEKEL